jgi:Fe-S cluster assembly protein SufD
MSATRNIVLTEGAPVRFAGGTHHAEPLIVEAGGRDVRIVLEKGAQLHATAFVLAVDREAALSLTIDMADEGCGFHLHALYIAAGKGTAGKDDGKGVATLPPRADIEVRVNHLAPDCTSRQLIKGIAADAATGSFTGMVHVAPGAQRTDASQRNQNLQLTDSAHVFTRPQLEIYADDVKCGHGATVGRLDEEAIYYMRQRGVCEAEARRMQIHGFAAEIVNHSPSGALRESISARIEALIDRL